ncbi:Calcineurin-like phosphoesterase [Cyclobacterium xiamenense]|uniref:Calcineurin-like phosphoesterase n=1 Tax=Cyclobacterium xiamenense TaxID=1297121 RepID=A0A1H6YI94_9BACT|nr:metallophosphoesterase [Cyclobacterium xiamenense]SEJ36930.1 Calcineurin-like phosphoesterase [Cyclobacterium xiamenense]
MRLSFASILLICSFANCQPAPHYQSVRIGMCSDVHLPTMHDSEKRMTAFVDSMEIAQPDFIIELGDFLIPDEKFTPFYELWKRFPGPKYHVIGNHEMDGGTSLQEALAYRGMENSYYTFEQKGFLFIVLDGNDKKFPDQQGYRSYIGPAQIQWLQKQLAAATMPIVIFSHQGIGSDPGNPGERYSIENDAEVRALFDAHNQANPKSKIIACFNGHTHHDHVENREGIWYITINSMSYKWLGEEYAHIRYSEAVDKDFRWIKYTAPYKDPLFTVVEISTEGFIKIAGSYSEYVGPSPWELGYPEHLKEVVKPQITERYLEFDF